MTECKNFIQEKEKQIFENGRWEKVIKAENFDEKESEDHTISSKDFSKMNKAFGAFGASVRVNKIKRIRSYFHLDDQWLNNKSKNEEISPSSDTKYENNPGNKIKKIKIEPKVMLKQAFKSITAFGSSTACVWTLKNQTLKIANLGDSTCMLIRFNIDKNMSKVILKTEEQQHNFNAPYQLAKIPENLKDLKTHISSNAESKRKFWKDKVSNSALYQANVKEGDIVIWATDGLIDNLYEKEIITIIDVFMAECRFQVSKNASIPSMNTFSDSPPSDIQNSHFMTKKNAKKLAKELVKEAYRKSKSKTWLTPFAEKFDKTQMKKDNKVLNWKGGKPDDICAVVGFVKSAESSAC